ncbi:MAG: prepilin peptidase [Patescibacteria group bacterium]
MLISSYILVLFLGLSAGSFINCFAYRLYKGKTILGRSFCPACMSKLSWYDNIPILSFLILKAKCRYCEKKISLQYTLIETITASLFILAFYLSPISQNLMFAMPEVLILLRNWFLISFMVIIFVMDFNWYVIVDKVSLPAAGIMLVLNLLLGFSWQNLLLAGIIGAGFFLAQFIISRGKWIGGGDVRLGLLMGFALGYPQVLVAMFLAYLLGSIIGVILIIMGRKRRTSKMPFGTFLTIATIICLFWGHYLLTFYLNLYK